MTKAFELVSGAKQLAPFRADLRSALSKTGLSEKAVGQVVLAVDEAFTNVIRHSYRGKEGKIQIEFRDCPDRVEITIRDFGKKFDPTQMPKPELPPKKPGGLGIYFIKTLMDKVEYDGGCEDGNRLCLTKYK